QTALFSPEATQSRAATRPVRRLFRQVAQALLPAEYGSFRRQDSVSAPLRRRPSLLGKSRARLRRHAKLYEQNRWNSTSRTRLRGKLQVDRPAGFPRTAVLPYTCVRGETHPPGKWRS